MSGNESSGESSGAESPPPQDPPPQPAPPNLVSRTTATTRPINTPSGQQTTPTSAATAAMVGPLLYQVPPNGVIFSLAQTQAGSANGDQPQFITIPLSVAMAATNGHQELDLSNKKIK